MLDPKIIAQLIDRLTNQVSRININCQCQRGPDTLPFTGRKDSAESTLSISDALRCFSIRSLVAAQSNENSKDIVQNIVNGRYSNFLNTDFIEHQKYQPAFDETYQMILSLKGEDGTVAYKPHNRNYRFVDTIGFICPFLVSYGLRFNVPESVDLAVNQIKEYQKYASQNYMKVFQFPAEEELE